MRATPPPPVVWVDGRPVDAAALHLSALDRGFTLADGLFETMRAYGGRLFRRGAHLDRLRAAATALDLPLPPDLDATLDGALRDAAGAGLHDASVRLTVSRGIAPPGLALPERAHPTVVVVVHALPRFAPTLYSAGITARVATGRRNERAQTAGLKTLGYADAIAALAEARRAGADEALFLDTEGHLSEATASNLFLIVDGALRTPPRSCGALPGITRAAVLELADATGRAWDERPLSLADLHAASEAFLTSSVREIVPLVAVDGRPVGAGVPGPVTRAMMEAYTALVAAGCATSGRDAREVCP